MLAQSISAPGLRLLVVEDDAAIRRFVTRGLEEAGHQVEPVGTANEALALIDATWFDAAVVDLMLPDMDGLELIRRVRERAVPLSVVVLSARRSVEQRVAGLRHGADDYLAKPFDMSELLARLDAVTRRSSPGPAPSLYESSGVVLDMARHEVTREGVAIALTRRELALLEHLMRSEGRPLSKSWLQKQLWGADFDPSTNVVDVLVCRLRGKIDKGFPVKLIHTLRGVGYVFRAATDPS